MRPDLPSPHERYTYRKTQRQWADTDRRLHFVLSDGLTNTPTSSSGEAQRRTFTEWSTRHGSSTDIGIPVRRVRRSGGEGFAVLVGVLGIPAALLCGVMASVLSPDVGLFGDPNRPVERAIGMACALATGPLLTAGLLYAGVRRRDPTLLVPAGLVAAAVSFAVTIGAT